MFTSLGEKTLGWISKLIDSVVILITLIGVGQRKLNRIGLSNPGKRDPASWYKPLSWIIWTSASDCTFFLIPYWFMKYSSFFDQFWILTIGFLDIWFELELGILNKCGNLRNWDYHSSSYNNNNYYYLMFQCLDLFREICNTSWSIPVGSFTFWTTSPSTLPSPLVCQIPF